MKKLTNLQKEILVWICLLLLMAVMGAVYIQNTPNEHPGMIRLHITANSNSPEDQAVKLKVRNEIIKYMSSAQSTGGENASDDGSISDVDSARKFLLANIGEIEEISEATTASNGFDYPASAKLGVTFIPEKSYEDLTLPAGNYEALNITLGEGKGHNWWCVIFPQLCIIGEDNGDDSKGEKIVIKSKVKEMIESTELKRGKA